MANGNYVQGAGAGNTNWAKGVSSSLMDLSKSLLAQGDASLERERQARLDKIAEDERNRIAASRKVLQDYTANYNQGAAREAAFNANDALKTYFGDKLAEDQGTLSRNLYVENARANRAGDPEYTAQGKSLGLTRDMVLPHAKSLEYMKFLQSQQEKGLLEHNQQAQDLVSKFSTRSSDLEDRVNSLIRTATPVFKGDETSRIFSTLVGQGVDPTIAAPTAQQLSSPFSDVKDLTEQAVKRQKTEQDHLDRLAQYAYRAATLAQKDNKNASKGKDSSYITPGQVKQEDFTEWVDKLDPGKYDKTQFDAMYKKAVAAGVNPAVAFQSLKESVKDDYHLFGLFRSRGPDRTGNDYDDFVNYAKLRQNANTKGGGGSKGSFESYKDLITPGVAPYVDPKDAAVNSFLAGRDILSPKMERLPLTTGIQNTRGAPSSKAAGTGPSAQPTSKATASNPTPVDLSVAADTNTPSAPVSFVGNDAVDRIELLRNNTPASLVPEENVGRLDQFFRSNPSKKELAAASSEFGMSPSDMSEVYTNFNSALEALGAPDNARQQRIDRIQEERDLVREVNAGLGKDGIKQDTLFIYPYDTKGNDKSWGAIVDSINSHPDIVGTNKLSRKEIEAARNNPLLQQELIDKANRIISADVRETIADQRIWDKGGAGLNRLLLTPALEAYQDFVNPVSVDSPEYQQRLKRGQDADTQLNQRLRSLGRLEEFIYGREGRGLPAGNDLYRSAGAFAEGYGDNTNAQLGAAAASLYGGGKLGKFLLGNVMPNTMRLLRAPKATPNAAPRPVPAPRPTPKASADDANRIFPKGSTQSTRTVDAEIKAAGKNPEKINSLSEAALDTIIKNPNKYPKKVVEEAMEVMTNRWVSRPYTPPGRLPSAREAHQTIRGSRLPPAPQGSPLERIINGGANHQYNVPFNPLTPLRNF